jgi:hypothetical protein
MADGRAVCAMAAAGKAIAMAIAVINFFMTVSVRLSV